MRNQHKRPRQLGRPLFGVNVLHAQHYDINTFMKEFQARGEYLSKNVRPLGLIFEREYNYTLSSNLLYLLRFYLPFNTLYPEIIVVQNLSKVRLGLSIPNVNKEENIMVVMVQVDRNFYVPILPTSHIPNLTFYIPNLTGTFSYSVKLGT